MGGCGSQDFGAQDEVRGGGAGLGPLIHSRVNTKGSLEVTGSRGRGGGEPAGRGSSLRGRVTRQSPTPPLLPMVWSEAVGVPVAPKCSLYREVAGTQLDWAQDLRARSGGTA